MTTTTTYYYYTTHYPGRYLENIFPDHDPLPVGFRWAAPPQRELAAATGAAGAAAWRETSGRGAGVGETDGDEGWRLGNGTVQPNVPDVRIRGGASDLTILT